MSDELRELLAELGEQRAKLEQSIEKFSVENILPWREKAKELEVKEQGLFSEYSKESTELDEELAKIEAEFQARKNRLFQEKNKLIYDARAAKEAAKKKEQEAVLELQALNLKLDEIEAQQRKTLETLAARERLEILSDRIKDIFDESVWGSALHDYQKEDVLFTIDVFDKGLTGVLNANVMGGGKTLESIAAIDAIEQIFFKKHNRKPRICILSDKSNRKQLFNEFRMWSPNRMLAIIEGLPKQRELILQYALGSNAACIANYEVMNTTPAFMKVEWDIVVMDEVSRLKGGANPGKPTQIFENARAILGLEETSYEGSDIYVKKENSPFAMLMSGTPAENKPQEIWCYLHLFRPDKFPNLGRFEREYCRQHWDEEAGKYFYKADVDALLGVLSDQVFRQDPRIVRAAWPSKDRFFEVVQLEGEQLIAYQDAKEKFLIDLRNMADEKPSTKVPISQMIVLMNRLRQINLWPPSVKFDIDGSGTKTELPVYESAKIDYLMLKLEELTADGESVVVWTAQFVDPLYEIQRRIKDELNNGTTCAIMDGSVHDDEIEARAEAFRQKEIDILLCNRMKVGRGKNFHKNPNRWPGGASQAYFLDKWWNPSANQQAEDRIWRDGAKEGVQIHYIEAEGTVDNFLSMINERKQEMFEGIFGTEEESTLTPGEWLDVLEDLI